MSWPVGVSKFLHDLYSSSNIIQVTISTEVIWAGHVARKGGGDNDIRSFGREFEVTAWKTRAQMEGY